MFKNTKILLTGGCGTVGRELIRQFSTEHSIDQLVVLDNNESALFSLKEKYRDRNDISFFLCDMRDADTLQSRFKGIDLVIHTAAYKHVILCEQSPNDAIQTNIIGVNNVIKAAIYNNVKKVVFTSSDKAVNPTSVMGASKLMGERLISAANIDSSQTVFASTRFGNVLGSHGSVIPLFHQQIKQGGPVTLTDERMTRFIMSIRQSVNLVINSIGLARGGEVFVTKMPTISVALLARVMIEALAPRYGYHPNDIKIVNIGSKPGEKLYEELMTSEETRRTIELEDYFVVKPAILSNFKKIDYTYSSMIAESVSNAYNSEYEKQLTYDELLHFLEENGLLDQID
ncbi:conserved protein of unknown function [Pseudodesulfovibrio profundus]|uniref:Polysaccharide biosynthesis protein CapD-like domain-containing protein n=1 Tax=Pseudodesulfovibrio profundus TaxID=57320 RepID=A0A2C8FE80_9BACT|nr:SDR family NAD(P)-dependent oxidoreductase [Pseudodesulfovibrio profundus]SOB60772.1 conserved protein of unknown function [Pseudodesulfovibrio profundus]